MTSTLDPEQQSSFPSSWWVFHGSSVWGQRCDVETLETEMFNLTGQRPVIWTFQYFYHSIEKTLSETIYMITLWVCAHVFIRVQLFATYGLYPARLLCPWHFSGKDAGVGCCFLLQGIFLTQGLNPSFLCFLYCKWILYSEPPGKPWSLSELILLEEVEK